MPIPFLFGERLGEPFTCKCSYKFMDTDLKWLHWDSKIELQHDISKNWILTNSNFKNNNNEDVQWMFINVLVG